VYCVDIGASANLEVVNKFYYLGDMLSADGDADAAVEARIRIGWSIMLHRNGTWPVSKENEVALQRAEMRIVRWTCNAKVKDRVPSKELRERLGTDAIILVLQQNRLRWYGHVLQKEDTDWVKKCMEYEVEGSRPKGRSKRMWTEVVQKDCQACN